MDARAKNANAPTSYVDFEPRVERVQNEASETLHIHLPGFAMEHLTGQRSGGDLMIRGERPLDGNRWSRFQKEFHVPDSVNVSEIRARFENGILYVMLPKLITRQDAREEPVKAQEPPAPPKATAPKPTPSGDQQKASQKPVEAKEPPPAPPKATAPEPKPSADQQKATQKAEPTPSRHEETKEKEKEQADGPVGARKAAGDDVKDGGLNGKKKMEPPEEERMTAAGVIGSEKFNLGKPRLRNELLLNVVVAVTVILGLGMYVTYKLRK